MPLRTDFTIHVFFLAEKMNSLLLDTFSSFNLSPVDCSSLTNLHTFVDDPHHYISVLHGMLVAQAHNFDIV